MIFEWLLCGFELFLLTAFWFNLGYRISLQQNPHMTKIGKAFNFLKMAFVVVWLQFVVDVFDMILIV